MKNIAFKKLNKLALGPIDADKDNHPRAIRKADLHFHYAMFLGEPNPNRRIYCVKANCNFSPELQPVKE